MAVEEPIGATGRWVSAGSASDFLELQRLEVGVFILGFSPVVRRLTLFYNSTPAGFGIEKSCSHAFTFIIRLQACQA